MAGTPQRVKHDAGWRHPAAPERNRRVCGRSPDERPLEVKLHLLKNVLQRIWLRLNTPLFWQQHAAHQQHICPEFSFVSTGRNFQFLSLNTTASGFIHTSRWNVRETAQPRAAPETPCPVLGATFFSSKMGQIFRTALRGRHWALSEFQPVETHLWAVSSLQTSTKPLITHKDCTNYHIRKR